MAAGSTRWRSARTTPGWPPAATTSWPGSSTRPPGRKLPGWFTLAWCTRWRSARMAPGWSPAADATIARSSMRPLGRSWPGWSLATPPARVFDVLPGEDGPAVHAARSPRWRLARVPRGHRQRLRPRPGSSTWRPGGRRPAWSTAAQMHAVAFSLDGAWVVTGSEDPRPGSSTSFHREEQAPLEPRRPGTRGGIRARTAPGWPPAADHRLGPGPRPGHRGEAGPAGPRRRGHRGGVQPGRRLGGHRQH